MDADVVIAGGGPAGAATALGLLQAGRDARRRVLLLERGPQAGVRWKAGEGLPAASRRVLSALGLDVETLLAPHRRCLGSQSLWGSDVLQTTDALRDPDGTGWHLDRPRFDSDLLAFVAETGPNLDTQVEWDTRVRRVEPIADGWQVTIAKGAETSTVTTRWCVDATGRAGRLAQQAGSHAEARDSLVAFSLLAEPESEVTADDPDAMTLVESVPQGWWYTACLPKRRRVVVFLTDADLEAAATVRTLVGFRSLLQETHEVRTRHQGGWWLSGTPRGGPAATVRRAAIHGPGWLAVGDAAAAFDPLSSQGIFTALYGGMKAAEALHAALSGEAEAPSRYAADLGRVLDSYDRRRRAVYSMETRFADSAFWSRRRYSTKTGSPIATRPGSTVEP